MAAPRQYIVLFDGVCNLCNRSVSFIMRKDRRKRFLFGSLQGAAGQALLKQFSLPVSAFNSFVLIEGDRVYTRSTAALRVLKHLGGGWRLLYAFMLVPPFIRDGVYRWISANRYKWFGKRDTCRVPTPAEKSQFLD